MKTFNSDSLLHKNLEGLASFQGISEIIQEIAKQLECVELKAGEVLIREGQTEPCAYVIISGRISLIKESEHNRVLNELGRGEVIAGESLLKAEAASSTAIAIRHSCLFKITQASLETISNAYPNAALKLLQNILGHSKSERFSRHQAFFLYYEGQKEETHAFRDSLNEALSLYGACRVINKDEVINHSEYLNEWILKQHAENEFLIFASSQEDFSVTYKLLDHADRVLIFLKPDRETSIGFNAEKIYLEAMQLNKTTDLILIHPKDIKAPKNTQHWLKQLPHALWHHIKEESIEDIQRIARIISGNPIAFVLGGGGAKSLLFLGFYKALKELNIPIDWVGGTCAGAMITTAIAEGATTEEMIYRFKKYAPKNLMNAIDFTLPLVSLSTGRSMTRYLTSAFGDLYLEDLWLNNFMVATNLTKSDTELISTGLAWKALRASSGIPIFLHPVSNDKGELLIDGAVMNNLPVDLMKKKIKNGKVITAALMQHSFRALHVPAHQFGLWGYLKSYLSGQLKFYHLNIFKVLDRTTMLASRLKSAENAKLADFCLHLEAAHVGYFQYGEVDRLVELGYRLAMEQAEEIKAVKSINKLSH